MISGIDLLRGVEAGRRIRPARVMRVLSSSVIALLCLALIVMIRIATQSSSGAPALSGTSAESRLLPPGSGSQAGPRRQEMTYAGLLAHVAHATRTHEWSLVSLEADHVSDGSEAGQNDRTDVRIRGRFGTHAPDAMRGSLQHPAVSKLRIASVLPTPEGFEADARLRIEMDRSRRDADELDEASLPGALTGIVEGAGLQLRSLRLAPADEGQSSAIAVVGGWSALSALVERLESGPTSTARVQRMSVRMDQDEEFLLEIVFTLRESRLAP